MTAQLKSSMFPKAFLNYLYEREGEGIFDDGEGFLWFDSGRAETPRAATLSDIEGIVRRDNEILMRTIRDMPKNEARIRGMV